MARYIRAQFHFNSKKARHRLAGQHPFIDHYNGRLIKDHEKWDAEHIIPLKSAWDMGFKNQMKADPGLALYHMKEFANDPRNLIAVSASSNRQRGAKTLWNWIPLNLAYIPVRNKIVRQLAREYGLTLSAPQRWAMDYSDRKLTGDYKNGIKMGAVRTWLVNHGFHRALLPF